MEETLVCPDMTFDVAESAAAHTKMGPGVISLGASLFVKKAEDETSVTNTQVLDTSLLVPPTEESISSESIANTDSGGPDRAEDFTELASDPLLDPPREQTQIINPVGEQEEQKPENFHKHLAPLGAEIRLSSSEGAQSERKSGSVEDEDGKAELGIKVNTAAVSSNRAINSIKILRGFRKRIHIDEFVKDTSCVLKLHYFPHTVHLSRRRCSFPHL